MTEEIAFFHNPQSRPQMAPWILEDNMARPSAQRFAAG
jgi:hypothetical protein